MLLRYQKQSGRAHHLSAHSRCQREALWLASSVSTNKLTLFSNVYSASQPVQPPRKASARNQRRNFVFYYQLPTTAESHHTLPYPRQQPSPTRRRPGSSVPSQSTCPAARLPCHIPDLQSFSSVFFRRTYTFVFSLALYGSQFDVSIKK